MTVIKTHLFIGNEEIKTDHYKEVRDPGRLSEVVGLVAKGTVEHVNQAVQSSYEAFQNWKRTPLQYRMDLLSKAANALEVSIPSLAGIVSRENGMLLNTTKAEMALGVHAIRTTVGLAESFFQSQEAEDGSGWVSVEKRPLGVIAGIVPWNAPIVLTMQKIAPAIVAGNTIVIKPSPNAPSGVSEALKKIAVLFPPGVINIIHGEGDVGAALTKHPLIRKVSFTGGGATAKHVMKAAADTLKNVQFELGGNDPAIVLDDANLDEILPAIVSGVFRRSGQYCFAIKRVYVHYSQYDAFYHKMCELVDEFKIGHQLDERTTFGPLNNQQQHSYINELINRLKHEKANMIQLGHKLEPEEWSNGYYVQPTIVRDIQPDHELVVTEQFGPVIPLIVYRTEEEVIKMANATEYGLGSSIWSSNFDRALRVAREIEAGMTSINGCGQNSIGYKIVPFGGIKQSGIGRENSEVGLAEYVEYHAINYHGK